MNRKVIDKGVFVLSIVCLIISVGLFINHAAFADEFNTSPAVINSGGFWIRLGFSVVISTLSGLNLFGKKEV